MAKRLRGLILALAALVLPSGVSAHQLDSATASLWERVLHLFSSPDHVLALAGALVVGAVLFWGVGASRRRQAADAPTVEPWRGRETREV